MNILRSCLLFVTGTLVLSINSSVSAAVTQTVTTKMEGPGITGTATFFEGKDRLVRVVIDIQGDPKVLTPGLHAVHLHSTGSCTSENKPFSESGVHLGPAPSGSTLPVAANQPYHLGDLANLLVDKKGRGRLKVIVSRVTLSDGPRSIFDEDGSALIIHRLPDQGKDEKNEDPNEDPNRETGGGRLACGVLQKSGLAAQPLSPGAKSKIEGPEIAGEATFTEEKNGAVRVTVAVQGNPKMLTPGLHGIHLHTVGSCVSEAKPFSGAGGHFDPGPRGSSTPVETNHPYHLGDLPNLVVDRSGRGTLKTITSRITLKDSPTSLFDTDGTAIIIHKLQDQIKVGGTADEAGGGRLACGVIQKSETVLKTGGP